MAQATDDKVNSNPIKIVGADNTTQAETNIANVSAGGGVYTNLRNDAGTEIGTPTSPIAQRPGVDQVIISTSTPLGSSGAFTSSIIDLTSVQGQELTIGLFIDQVSAASGLQIQWSHDSSNFDHIESYTNLAAMTAGNGKTFTQRKVARYLRIVYTNGAIAQGAFRLTVSLNSTTAKASSHRLGSILDDNNDAELVKANMVGRKADGSHDNVKLNANNELATSNLLDASGVQGNISVSTSAVAVRVGGSNLANRKNLFFQNNGTATIFWGYTAGVTTTTGMPLMRNQFVMGDWGPNTTIYLIAASGSHDVRVNEGA